MNFQSRYGKPILPLPTLLAEQLYLVSRNAEIVQLSKDVLKSQELTIPTKS